MKTVIIIQARMTSTRLPGKILKEVLNKPLLEYQIERLRRVNFADNILIATTINDTDQPIVDFCSQHNIEIFRGSENNVLSRYYQSAKKINADAVIRITSDCPLIDPQIVDNITQFYLENSAKYDYVSNTLNRTYPYGMDTEIFSFKALEEAYNEASSQSALEHVTPFIYSNQNCYRLYNVVNNIDYSNYRWTVDTEEDFKLITEIIRSLYPIKPEFTFEDILGLVINNEKLSLINSHIKQKSIKEDEEYEYI